MVRLLEFAGGQLQQSVIAKHYGFSTSKTSKLLTKMEKKGIVTRQRKGNETLVTLIVHEMKQNK